MQSDIPPLRLAILEDEQGQAVKLGSGAYGQVQSPRFASACEKHSCACMSSQILKHLSETAGRPLITGSVQIGLLVMFETDMTG